jgi:hypothetical protein
MTHCVPKTSSIFSSSFSSHILVMHQLAKSVPSSSSKGGFFHVKDLLCASEAAAAAVAVFRNLSKIYVE